MTDILKKILETKSLEVIAGAKKQPLRTLSSMAEDLPPTRGFTSAIRQRIDQRESAVIAEVKKASPSKGLIRPDFDVKSIVRSYEESGATCLSVLTDVSYFQGSNNYLSKALEYASLPILRKDFMIDPWHIYQSRVLGADCILLIVGALGDAMLLELTLLARELGMDVLTEVHNEEELERALATPTELIGINNRNLRTFETSLDTSIRLKPMIPDDRIVIAESGIHEHADIVTLQQADIYAYLIGESFMRQQDPGLALQSIVYDKKSD